MKRPKAREWRVVLIVEDDSDGQVLKRLARASDLPIVVDWLPAHGIGNIKRRGEALVKLARDRIEGGRGCVGVLVDRDRLDTKTDEPHRTIREMCEATSTPYVEAVEAIEAWLLADEGIVQWLGLKARPDVDRIRDPKRVVSTGFFKKTKRPYRRRRGRLQLSEKATGVSAQRSRSWSRAMGHLMECGVTKGSLARFMRNSPLKGGALELRRDRSPTRRQRL